MRPLVLVITLLAAGPAYCGSPFKFAAINFPGATATQARGINDSGEIVGFYQTSSCSNSSLQVPTCPTHGYKFVNGRFTELNIPPSISTAVTGVNDHGDIVGFCQWPDSTYHGFLWRPTNLIETLDYPGTSFTTVPKALHNTLAVVGGLWSVSATGSFVNGGWVCSGGREGTHDVDVPPGYITMMYPNASATYPFGLNLLRAVVGTYDAGGCTDFSRRPTSDWGRHVDLDIPAPGST